MKNVISRKDITVPTKEKLDRILLQTLPEVSSLRLIIERMNDGHKFSNQYIIDSIIRSSDLVLSISNLSATNLDSVFILMRSQLEVNVDLHWFYSFYLKDKSISDNLAKRFYQFGANQYLEISENYETIFQMDPYLKTVESKLDPLKDKLKAKQTQYIALIDPQAKPSIQRIQRMYWQALPNLIEKKEELEFKARAEIATEVARRISNLKYAPFYRNWKILNGFTHWSAARMKYLDSDVSEAFYLRNLNLSLGFLHDMMNIGYVLKGIDAPPKIILLRKQFHYFST